MSVRIVQIANDVSIEQANEIDALGAMLPAIDAAKKLVKSYDDRFKALTASISTTTPVEQGRMVPGEHFMLDVAPVTQTRKIKNLGKLIELLGAEVFLQVCKVNITDIVKYVPEHQLDLVLTKEPGKTRTAKLVKRG